MEDRVKYWADRWNNAECGWHKNVVNPILVDHFHNIAKENEGPKRIFLPLCGKSIDLKWIYDQGHEVVGLEGVSQPILDFFKEQGFAYIIENEGDIDVYMTEDRRIKIYHTDLFKLKPEVTGKFDAVWDRGSLVAIYKEDRQIYAELLKKLLKEKFSYLIATVEYDQSLFPGPPRSVSVSEITSLFGGFCNIQVLEKLDVNRDPTSPASAKVRWNIDEFHEIVVLLTPKSD